MVLLRGSGVVVLDLLFPQLLASNSIVSLRFGRFGFGLGKNRREKAPNRAIRFRTRSTGPQTGPSGADPGQPAANRTAGPETGPTGRQTGHAGANSGPTGPPTGSFDLDIRRSPPPPPPPPPPPSQV